MVTPKEFSKEFPKKHDKKLQERYPYKLVETCPIQLQGMLTGTPGGTPRRIS